MTWPLLFALTLLMGKRNMGQLPVFDFIIVITIGSIAGADLADPAVPHGPTVLTLVAIGMLQYGFTKLQVKSSMVRQWSHLTPTVIIQDGEFLTHNLAQIRYTVNDVLPLLRKQGAFNLSDIDYAVVEPDGNISVLKKTAVSPLTPSDMGLKIANRSLPHLFIADGLLVPNGLKNSGVDQEWLENAIRHHGFKDISEVYLASLENNGNLYLSPSRSHKVGRSLHY
jgi:uncharacterized membrane protein YcaP (DUF421 family)